MKRMVRLIACFLVVTGIAWWSGYGMRSSSTTFAEACSTYSRPGIICGMEVGYITPGACSCGGGVTGDYVSYRCLCMDLDSGKWFGTGGGWFCDCN